MAGSSQTSSGHSRFAIARKDVNALAKPGHDGETPRCCKNLTARRRELLLRALPGLRSGQCYRVVGFMEPVVDHDDTEPSV
jgi:hypothetical protein